MFSSGVRSSSELKRILALPSRDPDELGPRLVNGMTKWLRKPGGKRVLNPLQALALAEAADYRFGIGPLPVGTGKTWIAFLLPVVLEAERPLLLLPSAHEKDKFPEEYAEFKEHWRHHPNLRTLGYGALSTPKADGLLEKLDPDVIIADEAHHLGDTKSLRTQRVQHYGRNKAGLIFVPLSASMYARTYRNFWHLQRWALPEQMHVLPRGWVEMDAWCRALDSKVFPYRLPLGALEVFGEDLQAARRGYGNRLKRTPGIWTYEGQDCAASIRVVLIHAQVDRIREESFRLRKTWKTLDDDVIPSSAHMWAKQRQLANGFYYRWKHEPPADWKCARADWHSFVREKLARKRTPSSPSKVAEEYPDAPELKAWLKVKDSFVPEQEVRWLDKTVVEMAYKWAVKTKGFVWVEHLEVGHELERMGLAFYHAGGRTSNGASIVGHPKGEPAVGSMAVSEGFNLQKKFHRCLILNAPPSGETRQQMLGRFHRQGQLHDEVVVEILVIVKEQLSDHAQAMKDAQRDHEMANPQKLCLAAVTNRKVETNGSI